jgi:hypothetical protein
MDTLTKTIVAIILITVALCGAASAECLTHQQAKAQYGHDTYLRWRGEGHCWSPAHRREAHVDRRHEARAEHHRRREASDRFVPVPAPPLERSAPITHTNRDVWPDVPRSDTTLRDRWPDERAWDLRDRLDGYVNDYVLLRTLRS